jgi:hypothetical protein
MHQLEGATAIALRIFELAADLAHRLTFPSHLDRRQIPSRMSWNASERDLLAGQKLYIAVHVASAAGVSGHATAIVAPRDGRGVNVHVVALRGPISCGVAIHAAGIHDHPRCLSK